DVSFTNDIQPIFDNKCNSCHSANIAMAGLDLSTGNSYNNLTDGNLIDLENPENSGLYVKVKSGHNGSTSDDACSILGWIEEGATNN
ncbi:MAG: hypothetical protein GXO79_15490, partial [Chlorobi bacterium]|nr:hypothetical protein [Chlorobiota bacterium]